MVQDTQDDLTLLVDQMTAAEKADLLSGRGLWKTAAIERLGIPSILMTDGAYGVRYSTTQIDAGDSDDNSLQGFLTLVNQQADDAGTMFGTTRPATCFPNGNLLGCSWDVDLAYRMGAALAAECQNFGVHLLLGPGINTRRTPLAGRAYEYYSEDPVINGDLAAALICGLQDNGVGASLKHFACNNSEIDRTTTSSDVDERALREIYLAGFERAIEKGKPWTVMSAYNPVNGIHATQNAWLLTTVLREEWGYDGLVLSDWHAIKDRPASLTAGTDLDMPESKPRKAQLLAAIETGKVDRETVDAACVRVLELVQRCKANERPGIPVDLEDHHILSRQIAAESIVLLRNENAALPLDATASPRIVVVGNGAIAPVIQGSGSATTNPYRVDIPFEQICKRAGEHCTIRHMPFDVDDATAIASAIDTVLHAAEDSDAVVIFSENAKSRNGEGNDRDTLKLMKGHDDLISALAAAGHRVIVVLSIPDTVEMPWLDEVDAVLACFFPGQGGGEAIARVLFGDQNPCGKLSASMPVRIEDIPGWHTYPGDHGRHVYSEGIFVGYRYYDLKAIAPAFPFGHGLSYTEFSYETMSLDKEVITPGESCTVTVTIRNTGKVAGKEIVQLYMQPIEPGLKRPVRELKAFAKVQLEPGEAKTVELTLQPRDFQYFDVSRAQWVLDADAFVIEAAASSRDVRLNQTIACKSQIFPPAKLSRQSPPSLVFAHLEAETILRDFLKTKLSLSDEEAAAILDKVRGSFLGFYDTLSWFVGDSVPEGEIAVVLDKLNEIENTP
ncbi:glycoside hydrolase family 3 C-terminal domain-containing protein [Rhizobium sp. Root483D2]|uniref:beta-glucosidase family protein n=1 Tax=Rhizobium sp. Root483D2 TaxID=1736545 RepID=UPI000713B9C9|nr:glycoside hydrolase family 3 C-terminal domain-containing protein [Rhizobium sp. Root483D2]KQY42659.1 beta-glucosidase [Rhizobium sp. Root483D2]